MESEPRKNGRPTRLTPETQELICAAIRAGNYVDVAAASAGVDRTQLYRWLKLGANARSGIHRAFHEAVNQAMADGELNDLGKIAAASTTQWQAAAWRLERRFPDRWGRKERVEHTGKDGAPLMEPATQNVLVIQVRDGQRVTLPVGAPLRAIGSGSNGHVNGTAAAAGEEKSA